MDQRVVHVPVGRLLDRSQTPARRVVWLALKVQPYASPAMLQRMTGLSRPTVLLGTSQERSAGQTYGPRVSIQVGLLADRTVRAQAKLLYGILQATPGFRDRHGTFTFASLRRLTGLGLNTLKRSVRELQSAGWLRLRQKNRRAVIRFSLISPGLARGLAERTLAERRLNRAGNGGEAIMQEYLSLLIDSKQFIDNARPGILINPLTGERLELDRFYPLANLGFEFQGTQHDRPTAKYNQQQVNEQRLRDLIKGGLCLEHGIHLVVCRASDLSLQGMIAKIGGSMPIRNLEGHQPLIELLEERGLSYRAETAAAEKALFGESVR